LAAAVGMERRSLEDADAGGVEAMAMLIVVENVVIVWEVS